MPHPPLRAPARVMLGAFYEAYPSGILTALEGLTDETVARRALQATDLTVAGIVVHLAHMEDLWLSERLLGQPPRDSWASAPYDDDPDWDFHAGA